ncbi:transposase, partial [Pseudoalteromonas sp. S4492]
MADNQFRQRDPNFDQSGRYKIQHKKERAALAKKRGQPVSSGRFTLKDFAFDKQTETCTCPAGKPMWLSSTKAMIGGKPGYQFCGYLENCRACPLKAQCLRKPGQKSARSVVFSYKPEGCEKPD